MKLTLFSELNILFLFYSFLGYITEVGIASIKNKKDINRGILNGPFCMSYGFLAIVLNISFKYTNNNLFLILLSIFFSAVITFITAKLLYRISNRYWWDFSHKKFNYEGVISLDYSIILGIISFLLTKFISPFIIFIFNDFDLNSRVLFLIVCDVFLLLDFILSYISLRKKKTNKKYKDLIAKNVSEVVLDRIDKAYPNFKNKAFDKDNLSLYKLFLIFYITGVIGCIIEVFFCRYSMGRWMHRSSLIFEEISLVWGGAFALCTVFLHKHKDSNIFFILIFGTLVGAFFEYLCSCFTEYFLGTVFWSYGKHAFNLNSRINLLFSLYWGIASVIYIKGIYPVLNKGIDLIPERIGKICVRILFCVFMIDLVISTTNGMRYQARRHGYAPRNFIEEKYDKYFPDDYMKSRFSNTIVRD